MEDLAGSPGQLVWGDRIFLTQANTGGTVRGLLCFTPADGKLLWQQATDEHGMTAVENKVHVHDLHATLLHLMGLDHTKLTYRYGGRDFRLTDVHGNVVKDIMT